ncbi:site-specific integrase [Reichenbachiella sp. MALMAid0571]|uniref:site-specific integrase n=1 Tax=Reichenbachiella sp. MALMAid0571 TaxID=3143939 RepID=UPI0032DE7D8E
MGHTIVALVNRSNRKNKSGRYKIQIRVTLDRKSKYFSLDESIELKYWSGKYNNWIKENHSHNFKINKLIATKINAIEGYIFDQKNFGCSISLKGIEEFWNRRGDRNILNDYIDNYLHDRKFNSLNTVKKYKTLQKHLSNFNPKIPMNSVNEALLQEFGKYLTGLGLAGATVLKYFDPLKKICRNAVKKGYMIRDPFYEVVLGIEKSKPHREYLELVEINFIKNVQLPTERPALANARKHFLFCFYAGIYYSDLRKLKWDEIINSSEGYMIEGTRHKNGEQFYSPIYEFTHAIEIIEMQKGLDMVYVFPDLISEQKYNYHLKQIARLAGIEKNLTNRLARHSFSQYWQGEKGIPVHFVQKMMGHTDIATTKSYYDTTPDEIIQAIKTLAFKK